MRVLLALGLMKLSTGLFDVYAYRASETLRAWLGGDKCGVYRETVQASGNRKYSRPRKVSKFRSENLPCV